MEIEDIKKKILGIYGFNEKEFELYKKFLDNFDSDFKLEDHMKVSGKPLTFLVHLPKKTNSIDDVVNQIKNIIDLGKNKGEEYLYENYRFEQDDPCSQVYYLSPTKFEMGGVVVLMSSDKVHNGG